MPFIVIEGPDYSGKTTTIERLKPFLKNAVYLREPGSSPLTEKVREGMQASPMDDSARQLIMHGCRLDMLDKHGWFFDPDTLYVLDRYLPSTYCYAKVDHINPDVIRGLVKLFPVPTPVFTFVLTPPLNVILSRALDRGRIDALEGSLDRIAGVHKNYLELGRYFPGNVSYVPWTDMSMVLYDILAEIRWNKGLTKFVT
jgi:thymidylate kinase